MGDTQYERDRRKRGHEARRLLALLEAAHAAVGGIESDRIYQALVDSLAPFSLEAARRDVAYYDAEDARDRAEEERKAKASTAYEELADAPERVQCQIDVARDMGRWTSFGRCENAAKKIVYDVENKAERCVCTVHAKAFLLDGRAGRTFSTKWHPLPSHEYWARVKFGKRKK